MKEYMIIDTNVPVPTSKKVIKMAGQINVAKYDDYYKIAVMGEELEYLRVKSAEDVEYFLRFPEDAVFSDGEGELDIRTVSIKEDIKHDPELLKEIQNIPLEDRPDH